MDEFKEFLAQWQIDILADTDLTYQKDLLLEPAISYSTSKRYQENLILKLTFEFALSSIKFTKRVQNDGYHDLARQLFRSATSIGANAKEAQNAESMADFIHKMKIALKEADESEYWLFLCEHIEDCSAPGNMIKKLEVILKILTKIVVSSKEKTSTNKKQ